MIAASVVALRADRDLSWPWTGPPYFSAPAPGPAFYARQLQVDPFPCYPHDQALATATLERCLGRYDLAAPVVLVLLDREGLDRVNGHCDIEHDYSAEGKAARRWGAQIVLWGKRVPPHPAMTRYLVAHEFGHAVAQAVAVRRGLKDVDALYREYRRLRPARRRDPRAYGGATWAGSAAEIFANDFRICAVGVEAEFWPHAAAPRPEAAPKVLAWWKRELAA